jgi:hypothetical protein
MVTKATHYGTCQWCSSRQKLPGGRLAKHGYTVRGGWFQGTCKGSSALPYELSKTLIDDSIAWARHRAADVLEAVGSVEATDVTATSKAWIHVYHPELSNRTRGSVYLWEEHELTPVARGWTWGSPSGRIPRVALNDVRGLPHLIATQNAGYVKHLHHQVREIELYIAVQGRRIADWRVAALTPISQ